MRSDRPPRTLVKERAGASGRTTVADGEITSRDNLSIDSKVAHGHGPWTSLLQVRYDARTHYPAGLVAEIRKRFPSPSMAKNGAFSASPELRQLADLVNQAMLAGSLENTIALRAQFAKTWGTTRAASRGAGQYCIGGAFMAFTSCPGATSFPTPESLGRALRRANPELNPLAAESFARDMLAANDCGEFERAWEILEKAISHGRARSNEPMGTIHASQVAGLDVFVADDTVTVLDLGNVIARCVRSGLSELLTTRPTHVHAPLNESGRPSAIRILSAEDPSREYVVPLESA